MHHKADQICQAGTISGLRPAVTTIGVAGSPVGSSPGSEAFLATVGSGVAGGPPAACLGSDCSIAAGADAGELSCFLAFLAEALAAASAADSPANNEPAYPLQMKEL